MGMRGIRPDLEGWQLDLASVRSRMYPAPTPRERERWRALWLLCRGLTASGTAQALGRDAHTIGRWGRRLRRGRAPVFTRAGSAALIFEQTRGFPPRTWRDATGGVDGGSAGVARDVGHRNGQLELESGAAVCLEAFRHWPEPQRLPELSAPLGVCPEASQEASGQGR